MTDQIPIERFPYIRVTSPTKQIGGKRMVMRDTIELVTADGAFDFASIVGTYRIEGTFGQMRKLTLELYDFETVSTLIPHEEAS